MKIPKIVIAVFLLLFLSLLLWIGYDFYEQYKQEEKQRIMIQAEQNTIFSLIKFFKANPCEEAIFNYKDEKGEDQKISIVEKGNCWLDCTQK